MSLYIRYLERFHIFLKDNIHYPKQMRLLQRKRRQQLEALGFPVFCVDRPEQIRPALNALLKWNPGDPIPQGIGAKIPEMPVMELPETNTVTDTATNTEEVMPK